MSTDKLRAESEIKLDLPVAEILRVAHEHGATSVRVFGSRARGDSKPDSDLDLLVRLDPKRSLLDLIAIQQDLEDLLGCKVDVVTENACLLTSANAYSRKRCL